MFQVSFGFFFLLNRVLILIVISLLQYLTNNINSNSSTLVKVIAAVLKFSPQQTQVVLERESHRKSLVSVILFFNVTI